MDALKIDGRTFSEYGMFHISNGHYIVAHALGQSPTSESEAKAMAAKIIALPDLILSAKAVLAWWDKFAPTTSHDTQPEVEDDEWDEFHKLRAAIAKATDAVG